MAARIRRAGSRIMYHTRTIAISRAAIAGKSIMPPLKLPALDPAAVPEVRGSGYPEPFRSRMGDRVKRRLGDACGRGKRFQRVRPCDRELPTGEPGREGTNSAGL